MLKLKISGQTLWLENKVKVVANSQNYLLATFDLQEEFKGTVTAHFRVEENGVSYGEPATIVDGQCRVPDALIKPPCFYITVTSLDGDVLITTNEVFVQVDESGIDSGTLPDLPDKTPNQYEEFLRMYNEIFAINPGTNGIATYESLADKPTINNIELSGNITLEQLGVPQGNFLTEIPVEYVTQSELDSKAYLTEIPNNYVTNESLDSKGYLTNVPTEFITEAELDLKGYLTSIPDSYATDQEVGSAISSEYDFITATDNTNVFTLNLNNKKSVNYYMTVSNTTAKTIAVSNIATRSEIFLELVYNAAASISWFSNITWLSGTAPVFVTGKTYRLAFFTSNQGVTWHGVNGGGW